MTAADVVRFYKLLTTPSTLDRETRDLAILAGIPILDAQVLRNEFDRHMRWAKQELDPKKNRWSA